VAALGKLARRILIAIALGSTGRGVKLLIMQRQDMRWGAVPGKQMALFTMLSRRRVSPPYRLLEARVPPFGEGSTTVMAPKVLQKKLKFCLAWIKPVVYSKSLFVHDVPRAPKGTTPAILSSVSVLRAAPSADEEDLTSHCAVTLAGRDTLLRPHLGVLPLFDNKPYS